MRFITLHSLHLRLYKILKKLGEYFQYKQVTTISLVIKWIKYKTNMFTWAYVPWMKEVSYGKYVSINKVDIHTWTNYNITADIEF